MKSWLLAFLSAVLIFKVSSAQEEAAHQVLIRNANVFDGANEELVENADVLLEGNLIKQIGQNITAPGGAEVIDAGGRTIIPGLIDVHWHMTMAAFN